MNKLAFSEIENIMIQFWAPFVFIYLAMLIILKYRKQSDKKILVYAGIVLLLVGLAMVWNLVNLVSGYEG